MPIGVHGEEEKRGQTEVLGQANVKAHQRHGGDAVISVPAVYVLVSCPEISGYHKLPSKHPPKNVMPG